MPVLEPVVVNLLANTTDFPGLAAAKAEMEDLGSGGAGVAAGGIQDVEAAAKDAGGAAEESGGKFNLLSSIFGNQAISGMLRIRLNRFVGGWTTLQSRVRGSYQLSAASLPQH